MTITPGSPVSGECITCAKKLTSDEIALTKKLVNRGATSFFCITCLAKRFNVTEESLRERIKYFRESGCALFL